MGLILDAACGACGYEGRDLRLGGTHAMIAQHDVAAHELFATPCCREVQSVVCLLGQEYPEARCETCGDAFRPDPARRYRISTLKGERLSGHACPRCGEPRLEFSVRGKFV